jgi:hypothetical protein
VNPEITHLPDSPATAHRFTALLSATRRSARLARWLTVPQLADWGQPHDTAEQIDAEQAAKAALHGQLPGRSFRLGLSLTPPATLRIAVSDPRPERLPAAPGEPAAEAESGRGLLIVTAPADRWGVDLTIPPLKTVWAELDQA